MRHRAVLPLFPALLCALLLTGCGSERAGGAGVAGLDAEPGGRPSGSGSPGPETDGVRIVRIDVPSAAASASPGSTAASTPDPSPYIVRPDALSSGGVADHGASSAPDPNALSAVYEVTNRDTSAMVYTVTFTCTDSKGGAMSVVKEGVTVKAGATVRGTVRPGAAVPDMPTIVGVHVSEVTRVPLDEAPGAAAPCPASGVRITADDGDAAMGLRVVGLTMVNCGSSPYHVDGYPQLTLLDDGREPVDGVKIVKGGKGVALLDGFDDPPAPVTLQPGQSARAGIMWRNTTGFGTAVNVPYVEVRAKAGAAPVMVTPHLDLGTTGKLGVSAWKPATG